LTLEERLAGLTPREQAEALLAGLTPEQMEQIRHYLDQVTAGRRALARRPRPKT
jgi:hypothetical protein